jgi:hypothetical protein
MLVSVAVEPVVLPLADPEPVVEPGPVVAEEVSPLCMAECSLDVPVGAAVGDSEGAVLACGAGSTEGDFASWSLLPPPQLAAAKNATAAVHDRNRFMSTSVVIGMACEP